MIDFIQSNIIQNPRFAAESLNTLLSSFFLLAGAGIFCFFSRRAIAAGMRHVIWFFALTGLLLIPALPHLLPSEKRMLWTVGAQPLAGNEYSLFLELTPDQSAPVNSQPAAHPSNLLVEVKTLENRKTVFATHVNRHWMALSFGIWVTGVFLTLLYPVIGQIQLRRISRKARPLQSLLWKSLLNEASATLGLRRRVQLLQSEINVMPLTWGWWRPKVLLPGEAEQWPLDRRRIVLLHELAHVKRWDCLTQNIARLVCALYWFNPLAWIAARQMRIERERACDDLVLNGGCQASDYATHLVDIAKAFRDTPRMGAIAMARPSGLEKRIVAIVDATRVRRFRPVSTLAIIGLLLVMIYVSGASRAEMPQNPGDTVQGRQQLDQLKSFAREKLQQAQQLAASSGEKISPEYERFYAAAIKGDVQTVTNMYESFKARHPQYLRRPGVPMDIRLSTSPWQGALEISLAFDHFVNCDPNFTQIAVDDIIQSIPRGSIYFGGTDPGRGLPTAYSKSQVDADPFYTLTQNALANSTYLDYLRNTYGERRHWLNLLTDARRADHELQQWDREYQTDLETEASLMSQLPEHDSKCDAADNATEDLRKKRAQRTDEILVKLQASTDAKKKEALLKQPPQSIYIPTDAESQAAFRGYTSDAQTRLEHDKNFPNEPRQIKPGENVSLGSNGAVQVSGQIAVMAINARLAKVIFDKNPDRNFYVEESFPLDWMYPRLEPHGLIMKISRQPEAELSDEVVQKDHDYWQRRVNEWLGSWLTDDTSVKTVAEFAEKIYVRKDLSGFTGDPKFIHDNYAPKMFSKWRGAIGGLYSWRLGISPDNGTVPPDYLPKNDAERQRLIKAADVALKQAFVICPSSPEAVYRYVGFLIAQNRKADAFLIAQAAAYIDPEHYNGLMRNLSQMQDTEATAALSAQLKELGSLVIKKEAELAQKKTLLEGLKAMDRESLEKALPIAMPDNEMNTLRTELDLAQQSLANLKLDYAPDHPKYKNAEAVIEDLRQKIHERTDATMIALQTQRDAAAAMVATLRAQLAELQTAKQQGR